MIHFIVKIVWFECEVYDENYVHMQNTVTWVHIQSADDVDEYYMGHYAKKLHFYCILCIRSVICVIILLFSFMLMFIFRVQFVHVVLLIDFFDRQRRKHTSTTPTHVNRQTDKGCAWGRPRLLHTVWKCYLLNPSWYVIKGLLRDYFT